MIFIKPFSFLLCAALLCVGPAYAAAPVQSSDICLRAAAYAEKKHKIPAYILSAIGLTETGRSLPTSEGKKFRPWPWTINVEGKGYFFKTKAEAIAAVRAHRASGKKSIDVGCMQVNLRYHGKAFNSPEAAFDPYINASYAGRFLKRLYNEHGSWPKAVERYHSATPKYYTVYRAKVAKNWERARKIGRSGEKGATVNLASLSTSQNTIAKTETVYNPKSSRPPSDFEAYKQARIKEIAKIRALVRNNIR